MLNSASLEAVWLFWEFPFTRVFLEEYFYVLLIRNDIDCSVIGNNSAKWPENKEKYTLFSKC